MAKLKWQCMFPQGTEAWFNMWPKIGSKSFFGSLWVVLPSTVIRELWKERNRRFFQDKEMDQETLCQRIERQIPKLNNEATRAKILKKNIFTSWDDKMIK